MNRRIIIVLVSLIFFCNIFLSVVNIAEDEKDSYDIVIIDSSDVYIEYGFKDLGIYYNAEGLTDFNMPFIVAKKDVTISKNDLGGKYFDYSKDKNILSKRQPDFSFDVLAENDDYYVINYNMKIKANTEQISVDFVPIIKGKEFNKYAWWNSSWFIYRVVNVDVTQVAGTQQQNFPVPILVNSTISARCDNGNSIRFVDSDNSSQYYYQFDDVWNTTGTNIIWVNITTLNASGCSFNMYYNNSGAIDNQSTSVWNSSYFAVYHMNYTTNAIHDFTSNKNNGTVNGNVHVTTGIVGDAQYFDGTGDYISLPSGTYKPNTPVTFFGWMFMTDADVREGNTLFRCNDADSSDVYSMCEYGQANDFYDSLGVRASAGQFDITDISSTGCSGFWLEYGLSAFTNNAYQWCNGTKSAVDTACGYMTGTYSKSYIGCSTDGVTRDMLGVIDEVRLSQVQREWSYSVTEYNSIRNASTFCTLGTTEVHFLESPTDFVAKHNSISQINLSWTKGVNSTSTYIERSTSSSWSRGSGTLIYNSTDTTYNDTGLSSETKYYYQAWNYNSSTSYFSSYVSANNVTSPKPPYWVNATFVAPSTLNITWFNGSYIDKAVLLHKSGSYPTTPTDGTVLYNGSLRYYDHTPTTTNSYYTIWGWNEDIKEFSTAVQIAWGSLTIYVYDENTSVAIINWSVLISNANKTETYVNATCNNPLVIEISDLPFGNDTMIRINKTWYNFNLFYMDILQNHHYTLYAYLNLINDTESYILRVINQNDYPVSNAKVHVMRYINDSMGYQNVSILLTDGNGYCTVNLIPNIGYAVYITADGYNNATFDLQPIPIVYVEDRYHTFRITATSPDIVPALSYSDSISFSGQMTYHQLCINFTDITGDIIDVQIIVYEINTTTNLTTEVGWYNTTSSNFSTCFTVNSSATHHVVAYLNHTYFGACFDAGFYCRAIDIVLPSSTNEFNTIWTNVFGANAMTWSGFIGVLVLMACLFSFGEYHAGIGLVLTGFTMLGVNYMLGILFLNVTVCIVIVIVGVLLQWKIEMVRKGE